jgi:hypothetical protein
LVFAKKKKDDGKVDPLGMAFCFCICLLFSNNKLEWPLSQYAFWNALEYFQYAVHFVIFQYFFKANAGIKTFPGFSA